MRKLFIAFILLFLFFYAMQAQEIKVSSNKPFVYTTEQEAIGKASLTSNWVNIEVIDPATKKKSTIKHTIYQGSKGGLFYVAKAKDNTYKKVYLPKAKQ